jgi:stringent starvation protein B
MNVPVPGKKETLRAWLARGVTMVHLDARRPGVVVPQQYIGDAHLRLNLSYRYSIPDLEVGDDAVQATLSFGGRPFHCVLPWEAIFGITSQASGDGQVWRTCRSRWCRLSPTGTRILRARTACPPRRATRRRAGGRRSRPSRAS